MTTAKFYPEFKSIYLSIPKIELITNQNLYTVIDDEEEAEYLKENGEISIKSHQAFVLNTKTLNKKIEIFPNPENTLSCQYRNEFRTKTPTKTPLRIYDELLTKEKIDTYEELLPDIIADVYCDELIINDCYILNKDEIYLYKDCQLIPGDNNLKLYTYYSFFIVEDDKLRIMSEQEVITGYQTKLCYWYIFCPGTETLHGKTENQVKLYDAMVNDYCIIHCLTDGVMEKE